MQISDRIFEILREKSISQKEFSRMTGIAESTISDWKRKGFNPSAGRLSTICKALDISVAELVGDTSKDKYAASDSVVMLSSDENTLLEYFRNLEDDAQKRLLSYVISFAKEEQQVEVTDTNIGHITDTVSKSVPVVDANLTRRKTLCKKLRRLSRLDRIRLDESEHASGLNRHLFKYFDFIGIDKLDYIKKYLSHIQPFMIKEVINQERFENAICVLDEYYRISVYIKVDATKGEELIVSFHENNKNGIAKREPLRNTSTFVYVFPETISSHVLGSDNYSINLFITRGVTSLPINVAARKCDEEGFWVRLSDISRALVETANSYLQDLYTADLDYSQIEPFYSLQQISFTSYGTDAFSSISLLVDSLLMQMSTASKQVADAALCIFCGSIEMTTAGKKELLETLKERYKVNSVKILPEILKRIEINIGSPE